MMRLGSCLVANFLFAVLSGGALFPGRPGYGVEPEEAVEDPVCVEECQSAEQAYQCCNSEVVVERLVEMELDMILCRCC
jgi:hypothetical protein